MPWEVPPLNPLRTFEAGARHLSFTRAAAELNVTPGAVSRQIRILEEFLGISLFQRGHRELKLTPDGAAYLKSVSDAFGQIEAATKAITHCRRDGPLHIWCSMTFAMRWLVPRLPAFHAAHPDRDVLFTTSLRPVDFSSSDVDVAIRLGPANWPGVISHRLVDTELTPVCSPALLSSKVPLTSLDDLAHHTLLHSVVRADDWANWLNATDTTCVDPSHGIKFESSSLAYQAAIQGMGVAMGQLALIKEDVEAGRLVKPFDFVLAGEGAFYLLYPERSVHAPHLRAFRDWILEEARQDGEARHKLFSITEKTHI